MCFGQMVTEIQKRKWTLLTEKVMNGFIRRGNSLANMASLSSGLDFQKYTVVGTVMTPQRWSCANPWELCYVTLQGKSIFAEVIKVLDLKRRLSWMF